MIKKYSFMLFLALIFFGSSGFSGSDAFFYKINQPKSSDQQKQKTPETGKDLYQKYCLTCHQNDGGGVPFTFPSLIKSNWVKGDKTRLIKILLNGLEGEITVGEDTFNGVMPKQNNLTDTQISLVLTYIRQNFENSSTPVTPNEVKAQRAAK